MNRRTLGAGAALLAVAAALVAAVVLRDASLALWTAVAVGVGGLAAGGLVVYAGSRRAYLLARYLLARPVDVETAAGMDAGSGWLRVRGEVAGPSDVSPVLSDGDVAARTLRLERRTHPFDLKWPGVDRRELGEETELGTLALLDANHRARFESDGAVTMAVPAERGSFGPGEDPPFELVQALQRHDRTYDRLVGRGRLGQRRLHVREATVVPGQAVEVFGLLTVDRDGVRTLRPAEGRGGTVAVGRGRRLPLRYLRGTIAGLVGGTVLLYLGWSVLGLAVV